MGYYDYSNYFQTLISNQNLMLSKQDDIILYIQVVLVLLTILFLYIFINSLFGGKK